MQENNKEILDAITYSIQEKKGQKIVIADFSDIENIICKYFVICQGNTNVQVNAITDEIVDYVRKQTGQKPFSVTGRDNNIWVAIDYGDVIVHVFQPEARAFYDLEHLWADAKLVEILDEGQEP